jgi:glycine/D-amino acid oxidase-like deaminating enzyme
VVIQNPGDNGRRRVVVVGAGIVGASIAFHLSRRDVTLTVIESGQPGSGTSGRSFAYLNSFGKEPWFYHDFNRRSMDAWDRFTRRLGADVGLRWGGKLQWESSDQGADQLRERVEKLQARGYPCRLIDEVEMRRIEPGIFSDGVTAAVYCENEGQVDPPSVARACLERAREAGARVLLDTPVTGLTVGRREDGGSGVTAVQTTGGDIECDALVLAAGVGTTSLAAMAGLDIPQPESPGVLIHTDPRPPLLQTVSVVYAPPLDEESGEVHLRQRADGSVMIGIGTQESLSKDNSQENVERLLSRARKILPALGGARAIPMPIGYRPMPSDGLPIIGFTGPVPNLYVALMHSGVTLAPIVGELATLEIVDGACVEMLEHYRLSRFD